MSYIGTSADGRASGLAIDPATDDIYVTGSTAGLFAGEMASSTVDAYATKLTWAGATVWTHQFGGAFTNAGTAIAFDSNGTSVLSRLAACRTEVRENGCGRIAMWRGHGIERLS